MIEMRKLRELVRLMKDNDLCELHLRDQDEQVTLRRPEPGSPVQAIPESAAQQPAQAANTAAAPLAGQAESTENLNEIVSPMVGTFYTAPSPDAEPFVRVGSRVEPETVVCVIEAMKVFNEIKAETTGTIEKILVGNGQAVEFGHVLFSVRPD